jgi:hypothetical protein
MRFPCHPFRPVVLFFAAICVIRISAEPSPDVRSEPPRPSFLILPLHVHVLSCADREDLDCKLTDDDVLRIIGKANGIWHKAGVHFRLEPILHEKAANVKEFAEKLDGRAGGAASPSLGEYRLIAPADSRALPGLHVYYIHQFSVNGVFLGGRICVVKEAARLRPVEGGIDEPLPRVTAHELGHAMGLPHRQDVTNLMASGTTGTRLNEAEVGIVRAKARKIDGAMSVEEVETKAKEAEANGESARAKALRRDMEQLPK